MSTSPAYIGYRLEAFVGVFTPVCIVATALRFYSRSLVVKRYDAGDWLIGTALIGQLAAGGIAVGAVRQGGLGFHAGYLEAIDPERIIVFLKYLIVMVIWYAATDGLAKLAVCLLYKHIFSTQRTIQIVVNITMAIIVGTSVGGGLAYIFGCTPFSAHWGDNDDQNQHCIQTRMLFYWGSFPHIITDLILLVVPIPTIWKLKASVGMRVGLLVTFLFGSMGMITSILRFVVFSNQDYYKDPPWYTVNLVIWTICEPGVYLIAACLLVYRPLLDKLGISTLIITTVKSHGKNGSGREEDGQNLAETPGRMDNKFRALNSIGGTPYSGTSGQNHNAGGDTTVGGRFQRLDDDGDEISQRERDHITEETDIGLAWDARYGTHAV